MFKCQFRLNEPDKVEVNRQITKMEKIEVIEPSNSRYYNSPIFLVNKKNWTKRIVIDLRDVNSLIVPKLVQLPQIEEMLDTITVEKPKYVTISDVSSAFWQVRMHENSRDLTSFMAPTAGGGVSLEPHLGSTIRLQPYNELGSCLTTKHDSATCSAIWTTFVASQGRGKVIWSSWNKPSRRSRK